MLGICLDNVRKTVPLVHNITNYVTVNDVANILLACGGSPIMSDEPEDVEDITSICGGLNINIGTLNQRSIQGMLRAGKKAAQLHHVLLLDPAGGRRLRPAHQHRRGLMEQLPFTVIRGNISEIKTLALGSGKTRGVDATCPTPYPTRIWIPPWPLSRTSPSAAMPSWPSPGPSTWSATASAALSSATAGRRWVRSPAPAASCPA